LTHLFVDGPKIITGDFALGARHRRIAISLVAGTLDSTATFSIAVASSGGDPGSNSSPNDGRSSILFRQR
jgi:hypothetical protein